MGLGHCKLEEQLMAHGEDLGLSAPWGLQGIDEQVILNV